MNLQLLKIRIAAFAITRPTYFQLIEIQQPKRLRVTVQIDIRQNTDIADKGQFLKKVSECLLTRC